MRQRPSLRDKLFVFGLLERSPDPDKLVEAAAKSIQEHPLASLFGATRHDSEGKVIHRSDGAGFGDKENEFAIERQIAHDESVRRHVACGKIDAARQVIATDHTCLTRYSCICCCIARSFRGIWLRLTAGASYVSSRRFHQRPLHPDAIAGKFLAPRAEKPRAQRDEF